MADDTIHSLQGDTVDALIWRERGLGAADIAAVLAANPGLADAGAILPIGTPVVMPALATAPAALPLIQLWD